MLVIPYELPIKVYASPKIDLDGGNSVFIRVHAEKEIDDIQGNALSSAIDVLSMFGFSGALNIGIPPLLSGFEYSLTDIGDTYAVWEIAPLDASTKLVSSWPILLCNLLYTQYLDEMAGVIQIDFFTESKKTRYN